MNQFLQRYEKLGESFDLESVKVRPSLRVNTLRITETDLVARLKDNGVFLEKIPFLEAAYYYEAAFSLASTIEYLLGYFYLQEVASMLPASILAKELLSSNANPPFVVLDLCAAPGSKTTQLAQLFADKASIVALDNSAPRLKILEENINRLGITSTILYKKDGRYVDDLGILFDAILLDAPCSGNFCIEPDFLTSKLLLGIKERSHLQEDLLASAASVLKPGGLLLYSTCSLEPEEDELVINKFLEENADFTLQPIDIPIGDSGYTQVFDQSLSSGLANTRRFWPHKTQTEGFFIALLKKRL